MDKDIREALGIEHTPGEERFYNHAEGVVTGLMPGDLPLVIQLMVAMIVVEMGDFVRDNYTLNGGAE